MNLSVRTRQEADGTVVVALSGVLDLESAADAGAALREAGDRDQQRMVLDLREVTFMDSSGLRLIVSADASARKKGRVIEIVRGPERVHRVFRMTLMDERLRFIDGAPGEPDP